MIFLTLALFFYYATGKLRYGNKPSCSRAILKGIDFVHNKFSILFTDTMNTQIKTVITSSYHKGSVER